ncbi:MAG TPA: macro domain-containing protein [Methylomirabilota bacterium]|nr:macro domain-containing protein [Methylomirabilota bacterium]
MGGSESSRTRRETGMRLKIGQSTITIERGDITDWEVDAIINAANSTLAMGTGVASTIKRKGGVIIEEEAMRQGPVEVGEAVLTTGGNLAATHVIHAAVMGPDFKTDGEQIKATTRAVLALAAKHRITSLALPALGTGVGHVPPAVCASVMLDAVVSHLKGGPSGLKRVVFVLYQDDAYKAFTDTLKRLGGVQ